MMQKHINNRSNSGGGVLSSAFFCLLGTGVVSLVLALLVTPALAATTRLGACSVLKCDEYGDALAGATLELRDETGTTVHTFETTDEGAIDLSDDVVAGASYTLHEVCAPAGYTCAEDVTFHVLAAEDGGKSLVIDAGGRYGKAGGGIVIVDKTFDNVTVSKRDPNGKSLTGARLTLTDVTEGTVVDCWASMEEDHEIASEGLVAGHAYRLTEDAAPEGYQAIGPISFELTRDGSVRGITGEGVSFDDETRTLVVTDALLPEPTPIPTPEPEPEPEQSTCDVRVDKSWADEADGCADVAADRPRRLTFTLAATLFDGDEKVRALTTQEVNRLAEAAGESARKTGRVEATVAANGTQEGIVSWTGLADVWQQTGRELQVRYSVTEGHAGERYAVKLVHTVVGEDEQVVTVTNAHEPEEPEETETPVTPEAPTTSETPTTTETPKQDDPVTSEEPKQAGETVTPTTTPITDASTSTDFDAAKGPAADELPKTGDEGSAGLIPLVGAGVVLVALGLRHRLRR